MRVVRGGGRGRPLTPGGKGGGAGASGLQILWAAEGVARISIN